MHFAAELRDPKQIAAPKADVGEKEMKMARTLVESMQSKWEPEKWQDEYRESLMKVIEQKIEAGDKELPKPKRAPAQKGGKVIDLVALLQESLGEATKGAKKAKGTKRAAQGKGGPAARHHHARRKAA